MLKAKQGPSPFYEFSESIMEELRQDVAGFRILAAALKKHAGIYLPENEKNFFLMAGRMNKVLRENGLTRYSEYIELLQSGDVKYLNELCSALTTHTTEFFREEKHFPILKALVTEIVSRKNFNGELRIWCAAASTGQEPYSIAMVLDEVRLSLRQFSLKILATDIDLQVLEKASEGIYSAAEMVNVSLPLRQKYFTSVYDQEMNGYQVNQRLRNLVDFAPFNLITKSFPFQFPFDIIFCRNVLIYFDFETRVAIINNFATALSPESYLFLGHAEAGVVKCPNLKTIDIAVYQRIP